MYEGGYYTSFMSNRSNSGCEITYEVKIPTTYADHLHKDKRDLASTLLLVHSR